MKRSYQQILKQIDGLKAEAEKLRRVEVAGVIERIRGAINAYGLTAADLGLPGAGGVKPRLKPGPKPGSKRKTGKSPFAGRTVAPKFRDANGNTWAGRGKRPVWLRDALLAGAKLEDFAVK